MKKTRNRLLSLVLCCALLGSTLTQTAFATEQVQDSGIAIGTSGLCGHHTEHTQECGYAEGTPGTPCNHEHTDECYEEVTSCVHEHEPECYPQGSVSENEATPSNADRGEPTECAHVCSEESGCITKELNCKHEHDGSCGYLPAEPGTPCTYVCEICKPQDSGQPEDKPQAGGDECICETLCTTDVINTDCPVCSANDVDLAACKGVGASALSVASVRALYQPEYSANLQSVVKDFEQLCLPEAGDVAISGDTISSIPYYEAWTKDKGNKLLFGGRTFRILSSRGSDTVLLDSDTLDRLSYPLLTNPSAPSNWGENERLPQAGMEFYGGFSNRAEKDLIRNTETQEEDYNLENTEFDGVNGEHWAGSNEHFFDYNRNNIYCFPLSVKEIIQHYGNAEDAKKGNGNAVRWTRTQEGEFRKANATIGGTDGKLYSQTATAYAAVSFAMELDTSKIEYVAEPSKMTANFAQTTAANGHEWIAAIKDTNVQTIMVSVDSNTGTVQHTSLGSFADVTALVAMLEDSSDNVVGYGCLTSVAGATESTINLGSFNAGNYVLTLYAIKSNGTNQSAVIKAMGSANFTLGGVQPPAHTHTPAVGWTTNSTHHWHACTDPTCPDKADETKQNGYGPHVDNDHDNVCDTCGESVNGGVQPPTHTHTPAAGWTTNSTHHWYACTDPTCPDKVDATKQDSYGPHSDNNNDRVCDVCGKGLSIGSGGGSGSGGGGGSDNTHVSYTLTFQTNGGSAVAAISGYSTTIDLSGYNPTREGYTFNGWYSDKELTNKITSIRLNGNKTVYAGWTAIKPNPDTGAGLPFTDVHTGNWFYEDVKFVYDNGLMSGVGNNLFAPYDTTNRAQVAVIFYRLAGSPTVEGTNAFTDVPYEPGTLWYYDAVTWAQQNGIMSGYGNNVFGPNDKVTREQLAIAFYNYAKYKKYDVTALDGLAAFTDAGNISPWARDAMVWAMHIKLINGRGNGTLDPQGNADRAEVAAMLCRFIEYYRLMPPAASVSGNGTTGGWTQGDTHVSSPQTGDSSA